jgi:MerR family copper efflux transcriptional regulator
MRATLQKLVRACHGDERPDCPILDDIAGNAANRPEKSGQAIDKPAPVKP